MKNIKIRKNVLIVSLLAVVFLADSIFSTPLSSAYTLAAQSPFKPMVTIEKAKGKVVISESTETLRHMQEGFYEDAVIRYRESLRSAAKKIGISLIGLKRFVREHLKQINNFISPKKHTPYVLGGMKAVVFDWDRTIGYGRLFQDEAEIKLFAQIISGKDNPAQEDYDFAGKMLKDQYSNDWSISVLIEKVIKEAEKRGTLKPGELTVEEVNKRRKELVRIAFDQMIESGREEEILVPGIKELLRKLKEDLKLPVYIVSRGTKSNRLYQTEKLGFNKYITEFYVDPDMDKTEVFKIIAQKNNIDISNVVVIGDDPKHDIEAAKRVGATAIGFAKDEEELKVLSQAGADAVIEKGYFDADRIIDIFIEKCKRNIRTLKKYQDKTELLPPKQINNFISPKKHTPYVLGGMKAVVFDWDRTIVYGASFQDRLEIKLSAQIISGKDNPEKEDYAFADELNNERYIKSWSVFEWIERIIKEAVKRGTLKPGQLTVEEVNERRKELVRIAFDQIIDSGREEEILMPGIRELLRKLTEDLKLPVYIVSRGTKSNKLYQVEKLGLNKYITKFYVDSDLDKAEVFKIIAQKNNIDISNVIVIGDEPRDDIKSAKEVGATAIGFAKDEEKLNALSQSEADAIIEKGYFDADKIIDIFIEKCKRNIRAVKKYQDRTELLPQEDRKHVAVTGVTGDIGRALVPALNERGHTFSALVRETSRNKLEKVIDLKKIRGIDVQAGDIFSVDKLKYMIDKCNAFYHFAAIARLNLGKDEKEVIETLATNGFMVGVIGELISRSEKDGPFPFIYAASYAVDLIENRQDVKQWIDSAVREFDIYIKNKSFDGMVNIRDELLNFTAGFLKKHPVPGNLRVYALSKLLGETMAKRIKNSTCIKIGHVYGPNSMNIEHTVGDMILGRFKGEEVTVPREKHRYFVYINDVAETLRNVIETPNLPGEFYLTGDSFVPDERVIGMIEELTPYADGSFVLKGEGQTRSVPDNTVARQLLKRNFTPFSEGLPITIDYYRKKWMDFIEPQWGRKFVDTILWRAYENKRLFEEGRIKNPDIIIGLETSWIPKGQMRYIQGLLNKLSHLKAKGETGKIIIRRGKGTKLASVLRKAAKKTNIPDSNIIILGEHNILESRAFDSFREDMDPEQWAFFVRIEIPEAFPENNYIRVLEMLVKAVDLWAGKPLPADTEFLRIIQEGRKIFRFIIAEIEPVDYDLLKEMYLSQLRAMKSV